MIIIKHGQSTPQNIETIVRQIEDAGLKARPVTGEVDTIVCVIGDESTKKEVFDIMKSYAFVERAEPVQTNVGYRIVARDSHPEFVGNLKTSRFKVGDVEVGNGRPIIIAGPCTVHSREQTIAIAKAVKEAGADMLRGGAYKPRTSPYDFRGLGKAALAILEEARDLTGLPIVTEVMSVEQLSDIGPVADILQIGARNRQNFDLLSAVGKYAAKYDKAVLLKIAPPLRKDSVKEVLSSAEYIAVEGCQKIILCERGSPAENGEMRNLPNPMFLRLLRKHTYLPVIGDPSHATGDVELVSSAADGYLAAKANGLIIEVRNDDEPRRINGHAVCDYAQSLPVKHFNEYIGDLRRRGVLPPLVTQNDGWVTPD